MGHENLLARTNHEKEHQRIQMQRIDRGGKRLQTCGTKHTKKTETGKKEKASIFIDTNYATIGFHLQDHIPQFATSHRIHSRRRFIKKDNP